MIVKANKSIFDLIDTNINKMDAYKYRFTHCDDDLIDISMGSENEPISLDIISYITTHHFQKFRLAYNRYKTIGRSLLSSIANQSYYDFKFTVVDPRVSFEDNHMSLKRKYRKYDFLKKY